MNRARAFIDLSRTSSTVRSTRMPAFLAIGTAVLLAGAPSGAAAQSTASGPQPRVVAADTPDDVAARYSTAIRNSDFETAASLMHPEALLTFRGILEPAAKADTSGNLARQFLGADNTSGVATLSDVAFFARVLRSLMSAPALKETMSQSTTTILGHVTEGRDTAHVVFRMRVRVGDATVERVEAMSLQRFGSSWRMLLTGGMEGLMNALRARARGARRES